MKTPRRTLLAFALIVLLLVAVGWLCLWQAKRQYALSRQLIAALVHNDTKRALVLVNAGADPNTHFAPSHAPTLRLLLDQLFHRAPAPGASPTALMIACGTRWIPPLERRVPQVACDENLLLLEAMRAHGANVDTRTVNGRTALHYASCLGRLRTMTWLLQHSGNINAQDILGQTPLMLAIQNDTADAAHLLLARGANPNVQNGDGETALFYTMVSPEGVGKIILPELLAHGADPTLRDKYGVTLLQFAQRMDRSDLIRLLKQGRKP